MQKLQRYFITEWNRVSDLNDNAPKQFKSGEHTKVYAKTLEGISQFFSGKLFLKSGLGIIPHHMNTRADYIRPYTMADLGQFLVNYRKAAFDRACYPKNKDILKMCTIELFLIGSPFIGSGIVPSLMLSYCYDEPGLIYQIKYRHEIDCIIAGYNYKRETPYTPTDRDLRSLDIICDWIMPILADNSVTEKHQITEFFTSDFPRFLSSHWYGNLPSIQIANSDKLKDTFRKFVEEERIFDDCNFAYQRKRREAVCHHA